MSSLDSTVSIVRPRPVSQLNRKVYLGLYDNRSWPEPDSRDEQRVRDYMVQKYENKRWYVAPTEAMKEEAKRTNEAALNSKPQVKPLRSLLGENASKLTVGSVQTPPPVSHAPVTVSVPLPGSVKSQPVVNNSHTATSQPVTAATGFDLLNDLGGDPFASTGPSTNSHSDGGFADFGNFDSFSTPAGQTSTAPIHAPLQTFPISNTPLQPVGIGPTAVQPTAATAKAPSAKPVSISNTDRYAALADLDSAFSAPVTTATSINWGGTDGGPISWGGTDSGAFSWGGTSSTASTPSHSSAGLSWSTNAAAAGSGSINWNNQPSAGIPVGVPQTSSAFGVPSTANPFGATGTSGMNAFVTGAPVSTVNPFGGAATSSTIPMTNFSQAGGMSISTSAGFGAPFGTQPVGFGSFPPVQNGGFGMTPTSSAYGGAGAFSQQQFMMPAQPGLVQTSGWGTMGQVPTHPGVPAQPVANPFLSSAMHQQVPPPSGSTNPFL
ncbi:Arf-GAP domain and FG repeat-containing protein 2 [Bulinus truncatus]|nr:Arf-GAP domain and FG repeat-containing protein 2 [Bulinus truncatus]